MSFTFRLIENAPSFIGLCGSRLMLRCSIRLEELRSDGGRICEMGRGGGCFRYFSIVECFLIQKTNTVR